MKVKNVKCQPKGVKQISTEDFKYSYTGKVKSTNLFVATRGFRYPSGIKRPKRVAFK